MRACVRVCVVCVQFASERVRLAKLTNKCKDEDLDFYVRQVTRDARPTGDALPSMASHGMAWLRLHGTARQGMHVPPSLRTSLHPTRNPRAP